MKRVLIVGCPRSGTSWLQLLVAQHPQVATTQETHLFDLYLGHVESLRQAHESWNAGMAQLFSEPEFNALWAQIADDVFTKIAATNPAATVTLEKTPAHVRQGRLILKLCPDVHFIHLIRDPRSVVNSLCAVGQSWGADWASSRVSDNARLWRSDVRAGLELGRLTKRYKELRYEDLNGVGGACVLEDVFRWIGLGGDRAFCESVLERCRIERLRNGAPDLKESETLRRNSKFYRKGKTDGWKHDLAPRAVRVIEYINADLMKTLGYRPVTQPRSIGNKPLALLAAEAVRAVTWRLRRGLALASGRARSAR